MIYMFTALYCEAHTFIRQFNLTKNPENTWFQEFRNEAAGIVLAVTGAGEIAAAATVGSVCAMYRPKREDVLFNVGICAHTGEADGIFLCNRITEQATGKTFYPDMLYRHGFREAAIVTGMLPWDREEDGSKLPAASPAGASAAVSAAALYDMEAAAVYQAGSGFFGPHQMIFLKAVSDSGAAKSVSPKQAESLMEKYQDRIMDYIRQVQKITESGHGESPQQEEELLEKLSADLHCSRAMRDSLRQYIRYLTLVGGDCVPVIQDMYEKGLLPCRDKREGKQRFEEFKRRVL